ncbi:c-type cytochrome [Alteromonas sp. 1_MG-2023]|uniref:c-type cytochrome n=1 Tax=Alteromonas sp. 1_MG-2023 TaxID=3062669 RepID=UPI0026E2ABAA|nr:c-type cytochrome [Alteromonas sp. 1_MG-2023]MDO6565861.1 c-type cytochrome [Alteromonas sp. 1_MG-2023]
MAKFILMLSLVIISVVGCDLGPDSPRGFSLPEGSGDAGKVAFQKHQCTDCHQIEGITMPDTHTYLVPNSIPLGGSSGRITTYGELVTSIVNPSHKLTRRQPVSMTSVDGESRMRNMNNVITVQELIDLVAYLQPQYKVVPYRTSEYRLYQLRMPEPKD